MSTVVLVVSDDHVLDQYVTVPMVAGALRAIGKPLAKVRPITSPHLQGESQMFKEAPGIVERYGPIADVIVFVVDVDCEDGRDEKMPKVDRFRLRLDPSSPHAAKVLVVPAQHEVEVWALWGVATELSDSWSDVRSECHPKERYFEPLISKADSKMPDKGRKRLTGASLARGWQSVRTGCPELGLLASELNVLLP